MSETPVSELPRRLAVLAGVMVFLVGAFVSLGWILDLDVLKRVAPEWAAMAPLTALAFMLSGAALCGLVATSPRAVGRSSEWMPSSPRRWPWQWFAAAVAFIGLLRLSAYLMGWNLGIDLFGFRESPGADGISAATRMAPSTALALLLLGCALGLATRPRFSVAFQVFSLLAGLLGWLGFSHYLYGGAPLLPFAPMAVHTSVTLLILSVGILCTRTDVGLVALLTSDTLGGLIARRLVPAVLVVPVLLGWLHLKGQTAGWVGGAAGTALLALASILILGALVWMNARLLHTTDTQRNRASAALRESEARFRATADTAPVMIWMTGIDRLCTFVNKGWLDFTGRSMNQELGSGWVEGIHPADRDRSLRTYNDAFDRHSAFTMEYRIRRHDGAYCWILDSGVPHFEAGDRFVGYVGSCVDVSDLKRAHERMRLVVEAVPDAIVVSNQEGQITLLNAQAEKVFGYTREELLGRSIDTLIAEPSHSGHADNRQGYLQAPAARTMGTGHDLYGRRKDGSEIAVEVGLNPIDTSEGTAILASIVDVTSRRALEMEAAQQRSQLAHLSRVAMLGELSGALAHELSQPLTAILSNAQAALRLLPADPVDLDELRNIVTDIVADDIRAGRVISRLRALLKNDPAQHLPLDVNEVALDALRLMRIDLLNRNVPVITQLGAGLPLVEGDRVQLQQVLLNLLINGREAMDGASDRTLTLRTVALIDGGVEVSVTDRGSGIPPENLERIFEPFVSAKPEGLGLGLAICRTIVTAHHGRLWATNNADRGASLHFTLRPPKTSVPAAGSAS